MKKKDTGGYALAYVLVIILVLCAVAMAICTVAVRNFQEQERSVTQTKQLYQAEGEIEKLAALAESLEVLELSDKVYDTTESASKCRADAKEAYQAKLQSMWAAMGAEDHSELYFTDKSAGNDKDTVFVAAAYSNGSIRIDGKMRIELAYSQGSYISGVGSNMITHYTCKITAVNLLQYDTYTITHLTAEGGVSG